MPELHATVAELLADKSLSDEEAEAAIVALIDSFDARMAFVESKFDSLMSHLGAK